MQIAELMTPNPTTVEISATLREATNVLAELNVRHLPVMEDGNLVGIISDRDISAALGLDSDNPEVLAARLDVPVTSIMSSDVLSVGPEDDVSEAIDLMLEYRLGGLPVVRDDPKELVGMVSYVDILREARKVL